MGRRTSKKLEGAGLQALMEEPALRATRGLDKELLDSAAGKALDEGFLGRPWGTLPADFEGIRHIAEIAPKVSVGLALAGRA